MQLISLLLSVILALTPGFAFLEPAWDVPHDYSISRQAREMITEEQLAEVDLVMQELKAASPESGMLDFFPLTLLDDFWQSLVVAYTHACFYSINDGLNVAEALYIQFAIAGQSTALSMLLYDLDEQPMEYDANQHFTWGFNSTKVVGLDKSRIHLNNYEIAVMFRRPVVDFMLERYSELLGEGQGEWQARWNAWVEGGAYGLNRREIMLEECKDFEGFNKHFTDDDMMDLWNNEKGRQAYLNSNLLSGFAFQQFRRAWDNGELIENYEPGTVTEEHRRFIFENTYLWNPTVQAP